MRVLFSAHGAFGHVLPMIGLASAFRDRGHEVRFATGEPLCPTVSSFGVDALAAGMDDRSLVAEARARWPETEHAPPGSWAPRMFVEIAAPRMLGDLTRLIESFRPDLVVREEGEHAAPIAAAAAGVPWMTHGWGSPLPPMVALDRLAEAIAPLWLAAGLPAPSGDQLDGLAVLDPCPASLYGEQGSPRVATAVRAAVPRSGTAAPRTAGRSLAYVGFGTVPLYRDQPGVIEAVTRAILSHSLDAVVTTPDTELGSRLTALDPEHVRVEQWVSLPELLECCALVVSHGGAGTALAALAAGVPLLLLPRGAPSQARMSRACAERGVAVSITDRGNLDEAIAHALALLRTEDRYRTAARELAGEIAATPGPDQIVRLLERLAR